MLAHQGGGWRKSETDRSGLYRARTALAHVEREQVILELTELALGRRDSLTEELRYSPAHLRRVCHKAAGEPFASFLRRVRLERAAGRLSLAEASVAEAAREAGYATAEAFTKAFSAHLGASPTEFARLNSAPSALMPGYLLSRGLAVSRTVELRRRDGKTARIHYDGPLLLAVQRPGEGLSWSWLPPLLPEPE